MDRKSHYHKPGPGQPSSRRSGKGNSRLQSQHTPQEVLSECTQRIPREAGCVRLQRNSQKVEKSKAPSCLIRTSRGQIWLCLGAETVLPQQAHRRCVSAHRAWQHWAETSQNPSKVFRRRNLSEKSAAKMALCHWSHQGRWDREQRANSSHVLTRQRSCQPRIIFQALPRYVDVHSGFQDGFPIVDGLHGGNVISLLL